MLPQSFQSEEEECPVELHISIFFVTAIALLAHSWPGCLPPSRRAGPAAGLDGREAAGQGSYVTRPAFAAPNPTGGGRRSLQVQPALPETANRLRDDDDREAHSMRVNKSPVR